MGLVMECHVYILRCSDGTLYTGWTNDLERRLKTHNLGKGAKYTRARLPVTLLYSEAFEDSGQARRREAEIKKMTRAEKLALAGIADAKNSGKSRQA
jgi:putative endonuclease